MAKTLENIVKEEKSELEEKVDKFTFGKFFKDCFRFAPAAYLIYKVVQGTFTPLLTVGGFILGNIYENWRDRKRFSYSKMKRDVQTAGFLGATDYWYYSLPDIIPNTTLVGKIAKTLFAVPLLMTPYLYGYLHAINLRDKYGLKGTLKGILTGKIFSYIKDYHTKCVKQTKKNLKQLMVLWPGYYLGFNVLTNIYHRIGLSVFNNMFLRIITGMKKKPAEYQQKVQTAQPAYA